MYTKKPTE